MPGPMHGAKLVTKPKNAGKTLKRVFHYIAAYKLRFLLVVVAIFISAGAQIAGTALLRKIIDNYLIRFSQAGVQPALPAGFIKTLGIMGAIYLLGALSTYAYSRIMLTISTGTLYKIRVELFTKMEALPIRYFDTHTHGELMSRYTNDTDTIREMLSNSVANFIASGITVISAFGMMLYYSWQLTILVVIFLYVMLQVTQKIGGKSQTYFRNQQAELSKVNGYIEELIEGQKVVKVFCHEKSAKAEFRILSQKLCDTATNANTFANILMPIMANLSNILFALTTAFGGLLAIQGILTTGTVVAFLQLIRNFSMPLTHMSQQLNTVLSALAGAERIFEVIDAEPDRDDGYVTLINVTVAPDGSMEESDRFTGAWAWKHPHRADGTVTYQPLKGRVEFDNVNFGYEPDQIVLNGVTLYAKPGQKIAFVGSTGAGKTTITNLINRFYDVPDGKIRYDGININKIKKADLRRSLAIVLQDTHLFTGTVMENIRYGKLDATDEEVIDAAKLANADFFIRHLPQGYQTVLTSDGTNLSQGQRQLLAIARAAVANPPVLILDEATSSIDTRTEALIENGMNQLMKGRTVFVIAHRLSTVRSSNAIMVLEHGKIIERGDHEELIARKGRYYQLYTGMFELD
jgi:ATP-binding cassette subfamily B multidrug efflux pump